MIPYPNESVLDNCYSAQPEPSSESAMNPYRISFSRQHQEYEPLLDSELNLATPSPVSNDGDTSDSKRKGGYTSHKTSRRTLQIVIALESAALLVLVILSAWLYAGKSYMRSYCPNFHLYSPADDAVEFKQVVFKPDFHSKSIYLNPPSPEVDSAWNDLYYDFVSLQIPRSQAQMLPNKSLAIPADPANVWIGLSVFHQLHCLDLLRKGLHPESYVNPLTGDLDDIPLDEITDHLNHCLDSLRQSIMCASDVSPLVLQWNERRQKALTRMDVVHTCRDFDKIREWAGDNRLRHVFDTSTHVESGDSVAH